ncbi:MAG: glycine--tRNA ligase subunit beta [Cyanobacteria bacterium]|nr:glycine--tRNA ligase subunit beta [Cyanobacteriota bacterium]
MTQSSYDNHYLLEIGTEELPETFLKTAPDELKERFHKALTSHGLAVPVESLSHYSTPRRLAIVISGLPSMQPDQPIELKGPPVSVGLNANGEFTQAAVGFAKKNAIPVESLVQETRDGQAYLVYRSTQPGKPTPEVLQTLVPEVVLGLSGSHFMRWANGTVSFSRPIRWLVSLWNDKDLPVEIEGLRSDRESRGLRLANKTTFSLSKADSYHQMLKDQHIEVDYLERFNTIQSLLKNAVQKLPHCDAPQIAFSDPGCLGHTVTRLVENPSVLVGQFDEAYLTLPDIVISTVMAAHQKYFAVYDRNSGKLSPYFLVVSNQSDPDRTSDAEAIIIKGNQRVLKARLEDARFFYEEDLKIGLEGRRAALSSITFQKGLGSLLDKTERLEVLAPFVAAKISSDAKVSGVSEVSESARQAARLCKADLATGMVRELTELQGIMGTIYAEKQGLNSVIAGAIERHYYPRFEGEDLGGLFEVDIALNLADKCDTLVAIFSQQGAKLPSGSKDPLGLRRTAMGVLRLIQRNQLGLNLEEVLKEAHSLLSKYNPTPWESTWPLLDEFLRQRLKTLVWDCFPHLSNERWEAVLATQSPFLNLRDFWARLEAIQSIDSTMLVQVTEPAVRISRIITAPDLGPVDPSLFQDPSEQALWDALTQLTSSQNSAHIHNPDIARPENLLFNREQDSSSQDETFEELRDYYQRSIERMASLNTPVTDFFEKVLVNDKDASVRQNRQRLLSHIQALYQTIAHFHLITNLITNVTV